VDTAISLLSMVIAMHGMTRAMDKFFIRGVCPANGLRTGVGNVLDGVSILGQSV